MASRLVSWLGWQSLEGMTLESARDWIEIGLALIVTPALFAYRKISDLERRQAIIETKLDILLKINDRRQNPRDE